MQITPASDFLASWKFGLAPGKLTAHVLVHFNAFEASSIFILLCRKLM